MAIPLLAIPTYHTTAESRYENETQMSRGTSAVFVPLMGDRLRLYIPYVVRKFYTYTLSSSRGSATHEAAYYTGDIHLHSAPTGLHKDKINDNGVAKRLSSQTKNDVGLDPCPHD